MSAQDRGWGPGWPNCQRAKIVPVTVNGVSFPGGVRREVYDLFVAFLDDFNRTVEPLEDGWCWGFACRPIGGTRTPSNHSWGLAVDVNAPRHPLGASGTFTSAQARQCRRLAAKYGLRWGGDYTSRKDEMHFEFMGTPADAARLIRTLGTAGAATPEDDDMLTHGQQDPEGTVGPVTAWQHLLNRYLAAARLPFDGDGASYGQGKLLDPDGAFGDLTVRAGQKVLHHAQTDGPLGHPVYPDAAKVTALTQAFAVDALERLLHPDQPEQIGSHSHGKTYATKDHQHEVTGTAR